MNTPTKTKGISPLAPTLSEFLERRCTSECGHQKDCPHEEEYEALYNPEPDPLNSVPRKGKFGGDWEVKFLVVSLAPLRNYWLFEFRTIGEARKKIEELAKMTTPGSGKIYLYDVKSRKEANLIKKLKIS